MLTRFFIALVIYNSIITSSQAICYRIEHIHNQGTPTHVSIVGQSVTILACPLNTEQIQNMHCNVSLKMGDRIPPTLDGYPPSIKSIYGIMIKKIPCQIYIFYDDLYQASTTTVSDDIGPVIAINIRNNIKLFQSYLKGIIPTPECNNLLQALVIQPMRYGNIIILTLLVILGAMLATIIIQSEVNSKKQNAKVVSQYTSLQSMKTHENNSEETIQFTGPPFASCLSIKDNFTYIPVTASKIPEIQDDQSSCSYSNRLTRFSFTGNRRFQKFCQRTGIIDKLPIRAPQRTDTNKLYESVPSTSAQSDPVHASILETEPDQPSKSTEINDQSIYMSMNNLMYVPQKIKSTYSA